MKKYAIVKYTQSGNVYAVEREQGGYYPKNILKIGDAGVLAILGKVMTLDTKIRAYDIIMETDNKEEWNEQIMLEVL